MTNTFMCDDVSCIPSTILGKLWLRKLFPELGCPHLSYTAYSYLSRKSYTNFTILLACTTCEPQPPFKSCICKPAPTSLFGFYLGYLWGRCCPPPPPSFPHKKILLSFQYVGNCIGKIIHTQQGHCTHCNISQNYVSKCTRLHLSAYSFQTLSEGACPWTP